MLHVASASNSPKTVPDHPDAALIALGQAFDVIGGQADKLDADNDFDDFRDNPVIGKLYDKLHVDARNLGLQILAIRATTIEGLQVKARCARWCDIGLIDDDIAAEFNDGTALASLVRDVLAMNLPPARSLSLASRRDSEAA